MMRGVRGAITIETNNAEAILSATTELLATLIKANNIQEEDVASILFTTTPDITACYPAKAARDMGWHSVALMGFQEMAVPNGLPMCIRLLIHWNTDKPMHAIQHAFMRGAVVLRPDIAKQTKQG